MMEHEGKAKESYIECAVYQGELWSVNELLDEKGKYKRDLQLEMRKASQKNGLFCPECGSLLVLCAGEIIKPYLRHHQKEQCEGRFRDFRAITHTKAILCENARRGFPEAKVVIGQKEHKYPFDFIIETPDRQYGIKYLRSPIKLAEWDERHAYYQELGIRDIWILDYAAFHTETTAAFEYNIAKVKGLCIVVNAQQENVILKKAYRSPVTDSDETFTAVYPLKELLFHEQADIWRTYGDEYNKLMDRLGRIAEIRREQIEKEQKEKELKAQVLAKKLQAEQEEAKRLKEEQLAEQQLTKQQMEQQIEQQIEQVRLYEQEMSEKRARGYQQQREAQSGEVMRNPFRKARSDKEFEMTALQETWILPGLQIAQNKPDSYYKVMCPKAGENRKKYLQNINRKLASDLPDRQKEKIVERALLELQDSRIYTWYNYKKG